MFSRTRKGGDRHEIANCIGMYLVLAILLSLAAFFPAPGRAADVPAQSFLNGAFPPPIVSLPWAGPLMLCRKPDTASHTNDIQLQEDSGQDDTETGIVLTQDEYKRLKEGAAGLSPEEYQAFKKLINRSGSTPWQVAAVNFAVIATGILVVGLAWIALLWIVRRMFDFWFDADVHTQVWPSVAVIVTLLVTTCLVVAAAVLR